MGVLTWPFLLAVAHSCCLFVGFPCFEMLSHAFGRSLWILGAFARSWALSLALARSCSLFVDFFRFESFSQVLVLSWPLLLALARFCYLFGGFCRFHLLSHAFTRSCSILGAFVSFSSVLARSWALWLAFASFLSVFLVLNRSRRLLDVALHLFARFSACRRSLTN